MWVEFGDNLNQSPCGGIWVEFGDNLNQSPCGNAVNLRKNGL